MIELICTLVLLGIVGAAFIPYVHGMSNSTVPLFRVQSAVDMETTMENIIVAFENDTCSTTTPYLQDVPCFRTDLIANFSTYDPSGKLTLTTTAVSTVPTIATTDFEAADDTTDAFTMTLTGVNGEQLFYVFRERDWTP